ncbi:hypothetical protein C8R44DRAFT_882636 [Mycena epipterygia]|nr:hypothetical protein C8R44DRAFT_882636 [Mycena epipterygia]
MCLQAIPFDRGTANYIQEHLADFPSFLSPTILLPSSSFPSLVNLGATGFFGTHQAVRKISAARPRTAHLSIGAPLDVSAPHQSWRLASLVFINIGPLSIKTDNNTLNPNFADFATPVSHHPAIQQHFLFFPLQCKAQIPADQILRKTFIRCIKTDEYAVAYPTSDPEFNLTPRLVSRMTLQDIKLRVGSQNQSSTSKSFTAPQEFHVETMSLQLRPPS